VSLYIGCPIWRVKEWVGTFLPAGTRDKDMLSAYSRRLNTVEGNTTFYALPSPEKAAGWRDATPSGFHFCLKFPKIISHEKRLMNCATETAAFVDVLRILGDRCGPSFLQLPPTFTGAHLPRLADYLAALPKDLRFAVEPRNADFFAGAWAERGLDELLTKHGMARGVFDTSALFALPRSHSVLVAGAQKKKPDFPVRATRTAGFAFVRFVGQPVVEDNRPWLEPWARRIAEWLAAGDDVYFFTHIPEDINAPRLSAFMRDLIAEHIDLPPVEEPDSSDPVQPTLL
jgi:uncharacterized protein YecE (DUF72 family)